MVTGNKLENHENQHGGYGYGVTKKKKVFMSFVQL